MVKTNKLKALMVEHGLTQAAAATALNITKTAFFNKLHNKTEFSASEIICLADLVGVSDIREIFFA